MIILVNKNGEKQDIELYRNRIKVSPEKKIEIKDYANKVEQELNACMPYVACDQSRWYQKEFQKLMDKFLVIAVYSSRLLDSPFTPNETTKQQMYDYLDSLLNFFQNPN